MNVRNILVHVVFVQILIFLFPSVVKAHVVFLEMLVVVDLREVVGLKEQRPTERRTFVTSTPAELPEFGKKDGEKWG